MSDYTPTGNPISASRGVSGLIRAEFALIQTAVNSKGNYAGQVWTGTHDYTGATLTVPTATVGDSSTKAASTAFVAATAFATALPSQTGNSGKYVTTNGVTASWAGIVVTGSTLYQYFNLGGF